MRQLVIMVKEPNLGRVKTRLAKDIGKVEATWWYRHQTTQLLRKLSKGNWKTNLAVSPDIEGQTSRVWPPSIHRVPQGSGDLGKRMTALFKNAEPGPVIIIGSDIPSVTRNHIEKGFRALERSDAVLGPSPDGGYWAIGLRRRNPAPEFLQDVRWSSANALDDTVASMRGLDIAFIDELNDVDGAKDL